MAIRLSLKADTRKCPYAMLTRGQTLIGREDHAPVRQSIRLIAFLPSQVAQSVSIIGADILRSDAPSSPRLLTLNSGRYFSVSIFCAYQTRCSRTY